MSLIMLLAMMLWACTCPADSGHFPSCPEYPKPAPDPEKKDDGKK